MRQYTCALSLATKNKKELINITSKVEEVVYRSGIQDGFCVIFTLHATAAVLINEDERGLKKDLLDSLEKIFPSTESYHHNLYDDNAAAHITSAFIGPSKTLIIQKGKLQRGSWQEIFLLELDGPRTERKILVKIFGE